MIEVPEESSGVSNFRLFTGYFCLLWYICILTAAYSGFFEILFNFKTRPILFSKKQQQQLQQLPQDDNDNNNDEDDNEFYEGNPPSRKTTPRQAPDIALHRRRIRPGVAHLEAVACMLPARRHPGVGQRELQRREQVQRRPLRAQPEGEQLGQGFVAAKHDLLWIMDSNVWASCNILKNSVITMNKNLNVGRRMGNYRPVKLVHHVPLAVSVDKAGSGGGDAIDLENLELTPSYSSSDESGLTNRKTPSPRRYSDDHSENDDAKLFKKLGANLDEMFLHTSHSKFYVLLNNLAIAPCVNGKSNMYRRSDLDQSVKLMPYKDSQFFKDPKFFARYIGEDNMIGIALWENCQGRTGLTGDVVIQPLSGNQNNTVQDYIQRRVRWLRVRKYMVLLATLIEPTTESLICGLYGTYAISTVFFNGAWFNKYWFLFHMMVWVLTDYVQYYTLINHSLDALHINYLPGWLKGIPSKNYNFFKWFYIWLIREFLALPIWIIAMIGHEIDWRGKPFVIKKDLTAEEL
ncbi:Ceramide glucosyltransferase [Candida viswanathii]|uniref:Ceramide glucosyltransferase n=1 Tax=Candida viswanathii TaxID=5486 RepID=A0A367XZB6_9ASCO|nr:Ceramide glucosyltransferase [Candida viswanathii]